MSTIELNNSNVDIAQLDRATALLIELLVKKYGLDREPTVMEMGGEYIVEFTRIISANSNAVERVTRIQKEDLKFLLSLPNVNWYEFTESKICLGVEVPKRTPISPESQALHVACRYLNEDKAAHEAAGHKWHIDPGKLEAALSEGGIYFGVGAVAEDAGGMQPALCGRCGTQLQNEGFCADLTCPYSDWPQEADIELLYKMSALAKTA